ncbi:MAG: hypothetical protein M1541_16105, partial [Acidobacteria bacterium]|nr:hypothetical protein [Acidobacteriota bacterium]
MSHLSICNAAWNAQATILRGAFAVFFPALFLSSIAGGQVFTLTRDQLIQYTAQNPYERFPDGRPKVPDAILKKVEGMSAEEALGLVRR